MIGRQRIFVDLDGTLCTWRVVTFEELLEPGFYASAQPNASVVGAVQILMEDPSFEVFSLSAYLPEAADALGEKNEWLDRFLPGLDRDHRRFCLCGEDKRAAAPGGIRPVDVLLDDYTFNLLSWAETGIGVKLMNGINGTKGRWTGARVSMFCSANSLAAQIKAVCKSAY